MQWDILIEVDPKWENWPLIFTLPTGGAMFYESSVLSKKEI